MLPINLNESQAAAAVHHTGPMMVLAGPGSGKTTVITYRIQNLIQEYGVDPGGILVITFTKAAAEEMRKRFNILSAGSTQGVTFSTFHALFFKILRNAKFFTIENILKDDERSNVVRDILTSMGMENGGDFLQSVLNEISLIKNELIDINYYNSMNVPSEYFKALYQSYEDYKKKHKKIDFDDMLIKCWEHIRNDSVYLSMLQKRYPFIMIDEFQDINKAQYECMKLLSAPLKNIFIVGDDDQSIYRFRGASPEFLLRFPQDYPGAKEVVLNINYRSTDEIINVCNKVISGNKIRYPKEISGTGRHGNPPKLMSSEDTREEAANIAARIIKILNSSRGNPEVLGEIAVIYRTNIQARAFADEFMNHNIPFLIKDEMPVIYEHWIALDICAYFNLAINRDSNEDLSRIINKPSRYINRALVASAQKKGGGIIKNLYADSRLQNYQLARLEELMFYLNAIAQRNAYDAIKYIRQAICYDDYIKHYADYRKINPKGLFEVLNELQESAKGYGTVRDYLEHVTSAVNENKNIKHRKNKGEEAGVTLTTMHSAKGLEYDIVFIAGAVEGVVPHEKSKTPPEIEEERRLLYVGMTRAKTNLVISVVKNKYEQEVAISRFLMSNTEGRKHIHSSV